MGVIWQEKAQQDPLWGVQPPLLVYHPHLQHGDAVSVSVLKDSQLRALPAPWKKGSTMLRTRFSQLEGRAHDAEAAREQTNSEDLLSG